MSSSCSGSQHTYAMLPRSKLTHCMVCVEPWGMNRRGCTLIDHRNDAIKCSKLGSETSDSPVARGYT